ncbi:MAG TPA: amino acid adenylation domain-containing protein, partial [Polyangiaceae bacterium]|nr:amino acid adenylation domain-containing protein [Polyangiaceae bacterium]
RAWSTARGSRVEGEPDCWIRPLEAHSRQLAEQQALVCEGESLTYRELWQRAQRVARGLRQLGVDRERCVGVCFERSTSMIVAMLGIWLAGGAFVPLDPSYPTERLLHMARDCGLRVALVDASGGRALRNTTVRTAQIAAWASDEHFHEGGESEARIPPPLPQQLAYVIYTSGSSGRPKGVAVSHAAILRHAWAIGAEYGLKPGETMLQFASINFDGSLDQWLAPLLRGAKVVLRGPDIWSAEQFCEAVRRQGIGVVDLMPAYLMEVCRWAKTEAKQLPLRVCAVGGEALPREGLELVCSVVAPATVINGYGPTECVVTPLIWSASADGAGATTGYAPIGSPIGDRSCYVLDARLNLALPGVIGELYIGGLTLARGYYGQPALTAERFIPDPFSNDGGRLYRTGDLVRWSLDGNLEYTGRQDRQIKLRGFRIEQGEIEAALLAHPAVQGAAVVLQERPPAKQLVAYVAGSTGAVSEAELRAFLTQRLPEYMIPARIGVLGELPKTPAGKVDVRSLPELDRAIAPETPSSVSRQPATPVECVLVEVIESVLGISGIGVDDNYFELGGDSIVSIQVVSRARARGLRISPRDVFLHQTVARLAAIAGKVTPVCTEAAELSGVEVPLTPIQQAFFEQGVPVRHHFNQAVLLRATRTLDSAALESAFRAVTQHHSSFRLRFEPREGASPRQYYRPQGSEQAWIETIPVRDATELEVACERAQRSLDLSRGPLHRAIHFVLADGSERLLLVIHHLVVDGVSWRILLEDLGQTYLAARAGKNPREALPPATSSFSDWSRYQQQQALRAASELPYWEALLRGAQTRPPGAKGQFKGTHDQEQTIVVGLSPEHTSQLLRGAPAAYRTRGAELLLCALGRALASRTGQSRVWVEVESHGRAGASGLEPSGTGKAGVATSETEHDVAPVADTMDLSRSVGWYTSFYPVCLPVGARDVVAQTASDPRELNPIAELGNCIGRVKDALRSVPWNGANFGPLRYLTDGEVAQRMAVLPRPWVTFNYLGQFDGSFAQELPFVPAQERAGARVDPSAELDNWLVVNGQVFDGRLEFGFSFADCAFDRASIEAIAGAFQAELERIVSHCAAGASAISASDFPLARLTASELDELALDPENVEDIYPLSPMQEGLMFHTLLEPERGTYVNQLEVELSGLDVPRFQLAWDEVVARHAALRTGFRSLSESSRVVQVVYRSVPTQVMVHDIGSVVSPREHAAELARREHALGFDLAVAPLSRLVVARLNDRVCRLIWTQHHLVLDGWSSARLMSEVLSVYAGRELPVRGHSYRAYIEWLSSRDRAAARAHFQSRLALLDGPTRIPADAACIGSDGYGCTTSELGAERTREMRRVAERARITPSTLVQGLLSLLMARHTGKSAVAIGLTVSGRPAELSGVEETVGLFINSVPVVAVCDSALPTVRWLRTLQSDNLELKNHEWAPLYQIQSWAGRAGQSLFDTLLVFENYPVDRALRQQNFGVELGALEVREDTHYTLTVSVREGASGMVISWQNDRAKLTDHSTRAFADQFGQLLDQVIACPEVALGNLQIGHVTPGESLESPARAAPESSLNVIQRLATVCATWPAEEAIECEGARLSFRELWSRSNSVARALLERGIGRESRVGVALERGPRLIAALIGVMKAGAAFVPLDTSYPAERLLAMVHDSGAEYVLVEPGTHISIPQWCSNLKYIEVGEAGAADCSVEILDEQLAYIIYTSGSSGRPKGVAVSHGALARHCASIALEYGLEHGQSMLQFASANFDGSLDQWLAPLTRGARIVMRGAELWDCERTFEVLAEERVDVADFMPSFLIELAHWCEERKAQLDLRICAVGGEALTREGLASVQRVLSHGVVINGYGPTEAVVTPLTWPAAQDTTPSTPYAPIGRPLPGRTAHVLDRDMNPLPPAVMGELYLGGPTLARGYHGHAAWTAERFLPDPFGPPG